jgi:hypothetical protein
VVFNHEVAIDVYYIHGFPALSVVCSSTTYVASSFLESRKSSVIWDTFMRIRVMNYTGAPSLVRLDAAGEHTSQEFRELAASSGIELVFSPVPTLSYVTKLKAADFAFNCTPPRTGIPPSVLVYGKIPRLPCADTEAEPSLPNDARIGLKSIARAEDEVQHARRRYMEDTKRAVPTDCDELFAGDMYLVYRDVSNFIHNRPGITGPFIFLYRQGSIAFVLDGSEVKKFAASHVKPAISSQKLRDIDIVSKTIADGTEQNEGENAPDIGSGRSAMNMSMSSEELTTSNKYVANVMQYYTVDETRHEQHASLDDANSTEHISPLDKHPIELESLDVWVTEVINSDHPAYNKEAAQVAITEEIQGLMDRGTFDIVVRNKLPVDSNIMGSRIVLALKNYKTSEECVNARLVIQGCGDRHGSSIVTDASTVSHFSVRVLLSISVLMKWKVWSKDARQALLQSEANISRNVYARLPRELRAHFVGSC